MNIENLKKAREKAGLTQAQAAIAIGVSDGTYKNYEQGKREPNGDKMVTIANLFGVTTDYLLGRDSQKSNELTPTQREEIATQKWLSLDKEKRDALLQMMETCIKTFEAAESNHKKSQEQEQTVKQSTTLGTIEDQMEEAAKTKEEASS